MPSHHQTEECAGEILSKRVHVLVESLTGLNQTTEKEFLDVGETLGEVIHRGREIARLAGEMAALAGDTRYAEAMDELRELLGEVAGATARGAAGEGILADMLGQVTACRVALGSFERAVRLLRVLGVTTRIESARVRHGEVDFEAVSDDILRLAGQVEEHTGRLADESAELGVLAQGTLSSCRQVDDRHRSEGAELATETHAALALLGERHERSVATAQEIAGHWSEMARVLEQLMMSLQFHDITRQQIEHVVEALEGSRGRLAGPEPDYGGAAGLAALQTAQLENTAQTLARALARIREDLGRLAARVADIAAQTRELAGARDRDGREFEEAVAARRQRLAEVLGTYSRTQAELGATVARVTPRVRAMAQAADQIDAVGFTIGLIALNAAVKTVHLGAEGAALEVLAEEIQRASADTCALTAAVAGYLRTVAGLADSLAAGAGEAGAASAPEQVAEHLAVLEEVNREIVSRLGVMEGDAGRLGGLLAQAREGLGVDRRAAAVLEEVRSGLAGIHEELARRAPAGWRQQVAEDLASHAGRYTTSDERLTHSEFTGGEGTSLEAADDDIELF